MIENPKYPFKTGNLYDQIYAEWDNVRRVMPLLDISRAENINHSYNYILTEMIRYREITQSTQSN